MFEFSDDTEYRRLPIYLLLDTSASMQGAPIEAMNESLHVFVRALRKEPHAVQTAHISIITFGGHAEQCLSLVACDEFEPPRLMASGNTPLGQALTLLDTSIEREVRKHSAEHKGDWKPLVFLFTDGAPTDGQEWRSALARIRERRDRKGINIISVGAPGADIQMLKEIGGPVLQMNTLTPESMQEFFQWVTASTVLASQSASESSGDHHQLQLPAPPSCIEIIL